MTLRARCHLHSLKNGRKRAPRLLSVPSCQLPELLADLQLPSDWSEGASGAGAAALGHSSYCYYCPLGSHPSPRVAPFLLFLSHHRPFCHSVSFVSFSVCLSIAFSFPTV